MLGRILVVLLLFAGPAAANDSAASLAAGGLVLERTDAVRMDSEDLYISADRISVTYRFTNVTDRDVTLDVAFPLPDVDVGALYHSPTPSTASDQANFVNFSVSVDGRPVAYRTHQTAHTPAGRDITQVLRDRGLPFLPFSDRMWRAFETEEGRPIGDRQLSALGALIDGYPAWTVRTAFSWPQTFPAGRTLTVRHEYTPAAGAFLLGTDSEGEGKWYRETYCAGAGEWRGILNRARDSRNRDQEGWLLVKTVDYILTTANNWAGPIGHFRLTIDKGSPRDLVSLCWAGGLTKTGPTTFEFQARNFRPTQDLAIAFVQATP